MTNKERLAKLDDFGCKKIINDFWYIISQLTHDDLQVLFGGASFSNIDFEKYNSPKISRRKISRYLCLTESGKKKYKDYIDEVQKKLGVSHIKAITVPPNDRT